MEKSNCKTENSSFELFIKNSITATEFEQLPDTLGVSKRMLTIFFRQPNKLSIQQLIRLSKLMGKSMDDFKTYL
jgi:plasmid maintenance system antidote protein VapI